MYNLNVSITGPPMLGVDSGGGGGSIGAAGLCSGTTPRTPEILNTVMQMANPMEYSFQASTAATSPTTSQQPSQTQVSQSDNHSSCSDSPLDSPVGTAATMPSVQQTCSQLIKTSLKLSLEMKRKQSTGDSSETDNSKRMKMDFDSSDDDEIYMKMSKTGVLTAEDEDRRRRRRERNKIAATKCRLKKRERTINLITESEQMEKQNFDLKAEVRNLESERISLMEMLRPHVHACGFQPPILNVPSLQKYLVDSPTSSSSSSSNSTTASISSECDQLKGKLTTIKISQQKIPSVNTLKFGGRRRQQHQQQQHLNNVTIITPVMTPSATITTRTISSTPISTPINVTSIDCKPSITAIDMGFCEGSELALVNGMMASPNGYCKQLPPGDCYAISSPDSGFIKSPVDISNYPTLQTTLIKSDYIPNCDTTGDLDLDNHSAVQMGLTIDTSGTEEFILKSELTDGNDSPYTTVQSADRFLFDGTGDVSFDTDMEHHQANDLHDLNHHDQQSLQSQFNQHLNQHSADLHSDSINDIKTHVLLHCNNNNNQHSNLNINHNNQHANSNNISNNNNNNNNNNHIHINNNCINTHHSTNNSSHNHMIEYNNACHTFLDSSLLKGDYLNQNADLLTITGDAGDGQFTDLDSGVTSYASMTNGSGCLA